MPNNIGQLGEQISASYAEQVAGPSSNLDQSEEIGDIAERHELLDRGAQCYSRLMNAAGLIDAEKGSADSSFVDRCQDEALRLQRQLTDAPNGDTARAHLNELKDLAREVEALARIRKSEPASRRTPSAASVPDAPTIDRTDDVPAQSQDVGGTIELLEQLRANNPYASDSGDHRYYDERIQAFQDAWPQANDEMRKSFLNMASHMCRTGMSRNGTWPSEDGVASAARDLVKGVLSHAERKGSTS